MDLILGRLVMLLGGAWSELDSGIDSLRWFFASGGKVLLIAGAALGLVLAIVSYVRTTEGLTTRMRVFLAFIRFVAVLCLMLVASGAVCRLSLVKGERPELLVVVDDSPSMGLPFEKRTRLSCAEDALEAGGLLDRLRHSFIVHTMRTSGALARPWGDRRPQELVEAIVRASTRSHDRAPLAQVLVISDGAQIGPAPLSAAATSVGAPISALSFGDGSDVLDVLIRSAVIPPFVYHQDRVLVTANVRSFGLEGEAIVRLMAVRGGKEQEVASARAALKSDGTVVPARVEFVASDAGLQRYVLRLNPLSGELTEANNSLHFHLDVREEKLRVLLVEGFRSDEMEIFLRAEGEGEWQRQPLSVDAEGRAEYVESNALRTFECYCAARQITSNRITVIVTERPRIVKMSVEYDLPAYVRRAPVVQPRSDGNLKALYGTSILLTLEANKNLKSVTLKTSFRDKPEAFNVGGQFAQGAIRADAEGWLKDTRPEFRETYTLELMDEFGFVNDDADHPYELVVTKDQAPVIGFVGLPHRSSASEPHIAYKDLDQLSLIVQGRDDYGIAKVVLHYRIQDLETGAGKSGGSKSYAFGLPRPHVSRLPLARPTQLGLQIGDRLVFWAEAEDAYDLGPEPGPHRSLTPPYRIAVVTEEQLFSEVRYSDEWSAQWYDSLKVASLARRVPPPRLAPEGEPAADVAEKLLDAIPVSEGFQGEDAQAIESYFESLAAAE